MLRLPLGEGSQEVKGSGAGPRSLQGQESVQALVWRVGCSESSLSKDPNHFMPQHSCSTNQAKGGMGESWSLSLSPSLWMNFTLSLCICDFQPE